MALRTSLPVQPHLYLADTLGRPLDGGKVFFGEVNKDPELYPINVFYDDALTIAAPQPVRSKGGFMNANGDMVEVYASEVSYSVKVLDSYGRQVFYAPDMSRANSDDSIVVEGGVTQKSINMGFSDLATIKTIVGANIGMRVYSKALASNFIFKTLATSPVNGGTVLQGVGGVWEMEDKQSYFASWFASPNVQSDQALKLQAGYAYATSKGKPFIIDDTYWVDGRAQDCLLPHGDRAAILILANSNMTFNPNGHIKVIPNNYSNYHVMIACNDVSKYEVYKPVLTGDRLTHDYTGTGEGEWGYGITLYESSDGLVTNPRISNMTGDCLYVGKAWQSMRESVPKDIIVTDPIIDGARRNGFSLAAGDNVKVLRPMFTKVGEYDGIAGKFPQACINVEPESAEGAAKPYIRNCIIESPVFKNSYAGVYIYAFPDDLELSLTFTGTCVFDSILNNNIGLFHGGANGKGKVLFNHVHYKTDPYVAFAVGWNAASKLTAEVAKVTTASQVNFIISNGLRGSYVGGKLGGVKISNIDVNANILFTPLKDAALEVVDYQFTMAENCHYGIRAYIEGGAVTPNNGKTVIQSNYSQTYDGFSFSSKNYANDILFYPIADATGTTVIYMFTNDDFRVLCPKLAYNPSIIGHGLNIKGLRIKHATGEHTVAHCSTLGGWLKFQNVKDGFTKVYGSYGEWTFS